MYDNLFDYAVIKVGLSGLDAVDRVLHIGI